MFMGVVAIGRRHHDDYKSNFGVMLVFQDCKLLQLLKKIRVQIATLSAPLRNFRKIAVMPSAHFGRLNVYGGSGRRPPPP